MDQLIEDKIISAQKILGDLGLPVDKQNRLCALTFLALAGQKPGDDWKNLTNKSMRLSKDIMVFVNNYYKADYKANSRESFRKIALKPFVDYNIALLNPDNPDLEQTSSLTHYSLSDLVYNTVRFYNTQDWTLVLDNYKRFQARRSEQEKSNIFLRELVIKNYKSIVDTTIDLGRFNVFIGANGSGKSNLLEVLACIGAAKVNDLSLDGLNSRGVRFAKPDLMISSFANENIVPVIDVKLSFQNGENNEDIKVTLSPVDSKDTFTKWVDLAADSSDSKELLQKINTITKENPGISIKKLLEMVGEIVEKEKDTEDNKFYELLSDYAIYDINTATLRGISGIESRKTPLGLNGEGLDLLISGLNKEDRNYINNQFYFSWLAEIIADKKEDPKLKGLKPGRSKSNLYFRDKFMRQENNIFSAENSNEGILHVLFYLNLFMSNNTPTIFAIDNIETALNPRLCRVLIKELARLANKNGKQVLITTHNPAILDGLNLMNDEQRLFEVSRNDKGFTKVERIQFKSNLEDKPFRLSDMWVKGLLGAVPTNF
ncbi:AAA family ATPase [Pedobacter miscanthi]|uniref:AAA family ATPase n=1 Tax=Pedobacter miscanthi TaxID=2259170 RepID=UPI00292DC893|nr:AAA family ATPase [Pedobacter miscanthi]